MMFRDFQGSPGQDQKPFVINDLGLFLVRGRPKKVGQSQPRVQ